MTNRQWRIIFGAVNAGCAFLLLQPEVRETGLLPLILGTVVAVLGFLRAPDDAPSDEGE